MLSLRGGFKASPLLALVFSAVVVVSFPQSDWVWGKQQQGSSGSSSTLGFSQTAPAASINRPSSSSSFFGTGASSSGNVADNVVVTSSQSSGSNKPTVIVQVLQPGSSAVNGLTTTSTGFNNLNSTLASTRGVQAAEGEGRIFPGVGRFVSQAINQFVNNNFANNGFLNTLLNLGNRFPTTSRPPTGGSSSNNNNNNNNDEFNTSGGGGGTGSSNNNNFGNIGSSNQFLGQSCRCIPASSCRLPSVDKGNCAGGIMCCRGSGTRTVGGSGSSSSNTRTPSTRFSPGEVRLGLFEDIVRGSGNVVDNAIDFLFAPYLTQEDQQRLATRIGNSGTRQG